MDSAKSLKKRIYDEKVKSEERKKKINKSNKEMYRKDKRKAISVRGQAIFNAIEAFMLGTVFILSGIRDYVIEKNTEENVSSLWGLIPFVNLVLAVSVLCGVLYIEAKYKKEPDDELSLKNKTTANSIGWILMALITISFIFFYFTILNHKTLVIRSEYIVGVALGYFMFISGVCNIIFLIIDWVNNIYDNDNEESEEEE